MAGRIPQQFIDELVNRIDIVELIDSRVPLKKAGKEYTACCPFHSEKTPSFTVSPQKQFYHCFGCGAHGTALGFLMAYEHMEFVEAVETLAARVGIEVPREQGYNPQAARQQRDRLKPVYEILERSGRYYRHQLRHHPRANKAIDYLKGRGLSGEIAARYGIGYAPPGWDNLLTTLGEDQQKTLLQAGLIIEKEEENKRYDRFRDRIMFPIRDRRGRTIGFGGRVLGDDKPKYLNSPETDVFHKGHELYGLYEARQELREIPRLLVVEGYMDVVALAQFGIHNAVATLGTAVTEEHLETLFRTTPEVVFCFDGDRAGRQAAWRGLENALGQMQDGRQLRFMFLPEGEDPDTLVRSRGAEAFETMVKQAQPLSQFIFGQLQQQVDMASLEGRTRFIELARPYLTKLPEGVYRQMMSEELAALAQVDLRSIWGKVGGRGAPPPPRRQPPKPTTRRAKREAPSPVRHAISLLLHQPQLAKNVNDPAFLAEIEAPGANLLQEMVELLQQSPHLSTAALLEHWRDRPEYRHFDALVRRGQLLTEEHDDLEQEFADTMTRIDTRRAQRRQQALLEKFEQQTITEEEKRELQDLLRAGKID